MRLLLDSHTLVWFLTGNPACSMWARSAIAAEGSECLVSAISAWEIAAKVRRNRCPDAVEISRNFEDVLREQGFLPLSLSHAHARIAAEFDSPHRDPFDRMLAGQSVLENAMLVSADRAFSTFPGVRVIW